MIHTRKLQIKPRGKNQSYYIQNINNYDINFGVGPAGTGKTYLAVACAARALEMGKVKRILLTRPAVEAGETLAFYLETWHRKLILIYGRSTMHCMRCWV